MPDENAERLRVLKEKAGLTWPQVAAVLHVTARAVQRWRSADDPVRCPLWAVELLAYKTGQAAALGLPQTEARPGRDSV